MQIIIEEAPKKPEELLQEIQHLSFCQFIKALQNHSCLNNKNIYQIYLQDKSMKVQCKECNQLHVVTIR